MDFQHLASGKVLIDDIFHTLEINNSIASNGALQYYQ
jgi:hypothetical protein